LLKKTILEFGASTRGFVPNRAKGEFTFHVGEGEQVALIGLNEMLVESRGGLGAKFIAGVDVLRWRALPSPVRGGTVQHGVGATPTTVKPTGLRIYENLVRGHDRGKSPLVLNSGEAWLELIRHLLLHENIYLRSPSLPKPSNAPS